MNRKSKREIENRLEELGGAEADSPIASDYSAGVTAPFVTYEDDPDPAAEIDGDVEVIDLPTGGRLHTVTPEGRGDR